MEFSPRLTTALRRLTGALDLLEAAAERRAEADATRADLDTELTLMQEDRARLGDELDASVTETRHLKRVNAEVAARLDRVGTTLRTLLAASPEHDPAS